MSLPRIAATPLLLAIALASTLVRPKRGMISRSVGLALYLSVSK